MLCTISFTNATALLPLPKNLVAFNSKPGERLFKHSHNNAFWALSPYFITEEGLAFCGIASGVMALNALHVKAPITPQHAPYRIFNQHNFFTQQVLKHLTPAMVYFRGATLDQIATSLKTFPVKVKRIYGNQTTLKQFRQDVLSAVDNQNHIMLVNFCRRDIGEKGCGHFSPVAAYNPKQDRMLILDVARYKYPPAWVSTQKMYLAISHGIDQDSQRSRGYLIISRQASSAS